MDDVPRLRLFAGPNGSGKSTVKQNLQKSDAWYGTYLNPDDIQKSINVDGKLIIPQLLPYCVAAEIQEFFASSKLLKQQQLTLPPGKILCQQDALVWETRDFNGYHASVLTDYLRHKLLQAKLTFTFESVMSHPDKIELLEHAQQLGYRTYLYYIATEDPAINVNRVRLRVSQGGHDVPENKIRERYYRSIKLLPKAIHASTRAFLFDSSDEPWHFATCTNGRLLSLTDDTIPNWFSAAYDELVGA